MRVVINQRRIGLSEPVNGERGSTSSPRMSLAKESNRLAKRFNNKSYSKIENIDNLLLKRDISVEKKKSVLVKKLHESIVKAFSINKKNFSKKNFDLLKKQLHNIRKIVLKLRSINNYLETAFLEDINPAKIKINSKSRSIGQQKNLAGDELETLEFTAYKLIGEVVMLDKRLLSEYAHREKKLLKEGKTEARDLSLTLKKESELLEHLEAKLPPPKAATINLLKEPTFTHWVARIFALLSYIEHFYHKEAEIFSKLKRNKSVKSRISKKISQILKEKSKLLKIMEEKAMSMKKFQLNGKFKRELHNFTTTINL